MLSFCGHSEHNTQAIFFHALIFKTIKFKTAERLKNIRIRKFEHDIFSIPFTVTSTETRRENEFLNQNSNYMIKNRQSNNLFNLKKSFELWEFKL